MKQRVITGILILLVLLPIFIVNFVTGYDKIIYILGLILAVVAMNEMLSMKETEKNLPFEVHLASYLAVIYISFFNIYDYVFLKIEILPYILIFLIIIMVLRKRFKINDASFIFFAIYYIGLSFHSLVANLTKQDGIYDLLYIMFIAIFTDTFAYFVGINFGKHKLCPSISPKKTIEGSIGGTLIATIFVSLYAYFIPKLGNIDTASLISNNSIIYIVIMTFVLSIFSQFGDLVASVMKRYYKIKDFGNLFPGHGGVLDRLDSILFTSLTYFYLTELITKLF